MFSKHTKASPLVWLTFDTTTRLAPSSSPASSPVQSLSVKGSRAGRAGREGKIARRSSMSSEFYSGRVESRRESCGHS